MKGIIYLEDGTVYKGDGFGASCTKVGELVFNTAMTGYQKTLTDPSYSGQIIVMTYPLLGNYGVNDVDYESDHIHAFGLVARDVSFHPSNWRCVKSLDEWLKEMGIPGVYNVDTREITRKLRNEGNQKCVITTEELTLKELKELCENTELATDQMKEAGVKEVTSRQSGSIMTAAGVAQDPTADIVPTRHKVAVLDFGVKEGILQDLMSRGCELTLFPYGSKAEDVLACQPDGIFLTNGPGDPESAEEAIKEIKKLIDRSNYGEGSVPIFGICMGHQLIALAQGGSTYKLKYGHRGANHGVLDTRSSRSYITSQNHGYAVKAESILLHGLEITHLNLNDGTVEGMQHISKPVFSVQFHPESNPGPNDSGYLFDRFIELMEGGRL